MADLSITAANVVADSSATRVLGQLTGRTPAQVRAEREPLRRLLA